MSGKNASKGLIVLIVLILFCAGGAITSYNSLVSGQEKVESSYADIDAQLQRRADLIPNLISSVKGYMAYEQSVIDSITESREKLLNAEGIQEMAEANDELSAAIGNLMVLVENYPDLKANENFIQLQDELAGTENRIATARRDYNDAVRSYNVKTKRFPGVWIARMFGFEAAEYFEAAAGSTEVPTVEF
ncbi:MAG: LemA family protein [Lachnospiraceae bacterium]|nr:LemA family protein [Lachnospiraceae bacterium]